MYVSTQIFAIEVPIFSQKYCLQSIQIIGVSINLDPYHGDETESEEGVIVEIARIDEDRNTQTPVYSTDFGPPDEHHRKKFKEKVKVDWENPDSTHVINVYSKSGVDISFTLAATRQSSLSSRSVLIAALIMVAVYIFILLELIHRTLVSIFGSMIALFFYFLMHRGETESIKVRF